MTFGQAANGNHVFALATVIGGHVLNVFTMPFFLKLYLNLFSNEGVNLQINIV
eukprot:CAMPEP_0116890392 /NCGR_PEP_ID=MMETSP0467-20121206/923_1 /TAXON_ID=283647 /ORGANISM="Mesodinium pulex, Strain SPMC105" /LENGTH=52 /DNA_ID=CAMNT_0004558091 /DNA_START=451 /DNA_END=609 /DNA_ORIENTATION=-